MLKRVKMIIFALIYAVNAILLSVTPFEVGATICLDGNHNIVMVEKLPPTANDVGYNLHYKCENCGVLFWDNYGHEQTTLEELSIAKLKPYVLGDVNDDDVVNNKDYGILVQYINNWPVVINQNAANTNADEKINNKDLGLLMQYINNWDVVLKGVGCAFEHKHEMTIVPKSELCNAMIVYKCFCGDLYKEEIPAIKISFRHTGTGSATINGYGTYTRYYTIDTTGGYGTTMLKYELFSNSTSTTPVDTIDFTTSNEYSLSSRGYSFSAGSYIVKITAKDNYGNVSAYRFKVSNESLIDYEVL